MMSVPDTLADGLNKIFANKNFPTSNSPILSRNDEMMKKSSEFELQESLDMSLESSKSSDSYDYVSVKFIYTSFLYFPIYRCLKLKENALCRPMFQTRNRHQISSLPISTVM